MRTGDDGGGARPVGVPATLEGVSSEDLVRACMSWSMVSDDCI